MSASVEEELERLRLDGAAKVAANQGQFHRKVLESMRRKAQLGKKTPKKHVFAFEAGSRTASPSVARAGGEEPVEPHMEGDEVRGDCSRSSARRCRMHAKGLEVHDDIY